MSINPHSEVAQVGPNRRKDSSHRNSFQEMVLELRAGMEMTQQTFAKMIGISPQYLNDLEKGRRLPSVAVTDKICNDRGPKGRLEWHLAGARAHGWDV